MSFAFLGLAAGLLAAQRSASQPLAPDESGSGQVVTGMWELPSGGFSEVSGGLGWAATTIGDLDQDGREELLVSMPDSGFDAALLYFEDAAETGRPRHRIGKGLGGFQGQVRNFSRFGNALCSLDDLDGDGIREVAVGAPREQNSRGVVWILFLDTNGEVRREVRIAAGEGGLQGILQPDDTFGHALAWVDDFDGDGRSDLAVGAPGSNGGTGAVWLLSLEWDGFVRDERKIANPMASSTSFGLALTGLGDLDGDGVAEIAVSNPLGFAGSVWIWFPNPDGTVRALQVIDHVSGGLPWALQSGDRFGASLCTLGDMDGDGLTDLVVGLSGQGSQNQGLVLHLFLNSDGTVKAVQPVGAGQGGFGGTLQPSEQFGGCVASIGDFDQNGHPDLLVGSPKTRTPPHNLDIGSFWILSLGAGGVVLQEERIGGVPQRVLPRDRHGQAIASLGDLDGDGTVEVVIGHGMSDHPIAYSVATDGTTIRKSSYLFGLRDTWGIGSSLARVGDVDGNGVTELAIGAPLRPRLPASDAEEGGFWLVFLDSTATTLTTYATSGNSAALLGMLDTDDRFGASLAPVGDFDGDGIPDLAVGAPGDDDGAPDAGAVYIAFLALDGSVREVRKISLTSGGLGPCLGAGDAFGSALAAMGDLDGNGTCDLAVGAPLADLPYQADVGVVWILHLRPDGTVLDRSSITSRRRGFTASLRDGDRFGQTLAAVGDLDGNGVLDLAVGAPGDDAVGTDSGAVWLLPLRADGRVRATLELSGARGGFATDHFPLERLDGGLGALGDVNGDGRPDLAVGSPGSDWLGVNAGFAWVLLL